MRANPTAHRMLTRERKTRVFMHHFHVVSVLPSIHRRLGDYNLWYCFDLFTCDSAKFLVTSFCFYHPRWPLLVGGSSTVVVEFNPLNGPNSLCLDHVVVTAKSRLIVMFPQATHRAADWEIRASRRSFSIIRTWECVPGPQLSHLPAPPQYRLYYLPK
jgi:hypothetical protein